MALQGSLDPFIPSPVPVDLGGPELGAGLGDAEELAAGVSVPEASVDEDDGAVLGEDDVGFAWEGAVLGSVDGEAESEAVEDGADGELGLGVARADARHHLRAFFGGEDVGHGWMK